MSRKRTPSSTPPVSWWSITTCGMRPRSPAGRCSGCESTMTTAAPASIAAAFHRDQRDRRATSTIARFSARAIIPSTVRVTILPG